MFTVRIDLHTVPPGEVKMQRWTRNRGILP